MLEFDTTDNESRDDLLTTPLDIQNQAKKTGGLVAVPDGPGLGIEPDREFIAPLHARLLIALASRPCRRATKASGHVAFTGGRPQAQ